MNIQGQNPNSYDFNPESEGDKFALSKLKGDKTLGPKFSQSASNIKTTLVEMNRYNENKNNTQKKDLYFTETGWKSMTKAGLKSHLETSNAKAYKFNKTDVKRLLATDSCVRRYLVENKSFVSTLKTTLELKSANFLKNCKIAIGFRDKTAAFTEKHWKIFKLETIVHTSFTPTDFKNIEELKTLERNDQKERKDNYFTSFTEKALKNVDLSPLQGGVALRKVSRQSVAVPEDHPSLRNPDAEAYKKTQDSANGPAFQYCKCKQQLDKDTEVCGDYVSAEHYPSHSVSVVMDAAENDPRCHEGARKLGDALTKGLNRLVEKHSENPETFKKELGNLLNDLHDKHSCDTRETEGKKATHTPSTGAFALRINLANGKQLAITGTVGDARVLHQKATGNVDNKSTNIFYKDYTDSGGAFGYEKMEKYNNPDSLEPVQIHAFILEEGDRIILGSDGMGDNLEARRLGISPKAAANALKEAGRLPEDVVIDNFSDKIADWKIKPKAPDKLKQMQDLHNAFIEYQAEKLLQQPSLGGSSPGDALFAHCTTNPAVSRGAERVKIENEMEKLRQDATKILEGKVQASPAYEKKLDILKQKTKEDLKSHIIESRHSSVWGTIKDTFFLIVTTSKFRNNELENEAANMLTAGSETVSQRARDIRNEYQKNSVQAKLDTRNSLLIGSPEEITKINNTLNDLQNELLKMGDDIVKEHPELEDEWQEAKKTQIKQNQECKSFHPTDYAASPVDLKCDGAVNNFVRSYSMKPDDVAISILDSKSAAPMRQRRQSIAEWNDDE